MNKVSTVAQVYKINVPIPEQEEPNILTTELIKAFETYPERNDMEKGDILHNVYEGEYRNDGKYIFDGEKLIELESEEDEYCHAPKNILAFRDVHPHFYLSAIEHNCLIYCDFQNIKLNDQRYIEPVQELYICNFTWNNETFALVCKRDSYDLRRGIYIYEVGEMDEDNLTDKLGKSFDIHHEYLKKYSISINNLLVSNDVEYDEYQNDDSDSKSN
jgi:hypothetical protein